MANQLCFGISIVPNGDYVMTSALFNTQIQNIHQVSNASFEYFDKTFWRFYQLQSGFYSIQYMDSGLLLTASNVSNYISLEPVVGTPSIHQQFKIRNVGKHFYLILPRIAVSPQKVLAITDTSLKQVLYERQSGNQWIKLKSIHKSSKNSGKVMSYVIIIILIFMIMLVLYRPLTHKFASAV